MDSVRVVILRGKIQRIRPVTSFRWFERELTGRVGECRSLDRAVKAHLILLVPAKILLAE